jgi:hypothetical protein
MAPQHSGIGAILQSDQLASTGAVAGSNTPILVGQPVLITGRVQGTAVQGLTVTISGAAFNGAGIIAILISLLLPAVDHLRHRLILDLCISPSMS